VHDRAKVLFAAIACKLINGYTLSGGELDDAACRTARHRGESNFGVYLIGDLSSTIHALAVA
jgi:hypothetical protein